MRTLMEAGNGGRESRAVTRFARMRPTASDSGTSSTPSTGVCCSTVACASGMLIILYCDEVAIAADWIAAGRARVWRRQQAAAAAGDFGCRATRLCWCSRSLCSRVRIYTTTAFRCENVGSKS